MRRRRRRPEPGQPEICRLTLEGRGSWEIPERSSWRSLFGTIVLDLRAARLAGPAVELDIFNLFGTVTVLVPTGVQVDVEGSAPFASQVVEPTVDAVEIVAAVNFRTSWRISIITPTYAIGKNPAHR